MGFFSVILLPVAFAIAAYLYFVLKRFCATISRPVNTRRGKLVLGGIALAIAAGRCVAARREKQEQEEACYYDELDWRN